MVMTMKWRIMARSACSGTGHYDRYHRRHHKHQQHHHNQKLVTIAICVGSLMQYHSSFSSSYQIPASSLAQASNSALLCLSVKPKALNPTATTSVQRRHVCVYICIHIYVHLHTYIHTYIHAYRHTDIQACRHAHMQTYRHIYIYMCTYTYVYRWALSASGLVVVLLDLCCRRIGLNLQNVIEACVRHLKPILCSWFQA